LKTFQATQEGEVNTSEAPLPSVSDTQHGYVIGTQDNVVTRVYKTISGLDGMFYSYEFIYL
jgi:hypothetical protein